MLPDLCHPRPPWSRLCNSFCSKEGPQAATALSPISHVRATPPVEERGLSSFLPHWPSFESCSGTRPTLEGDSKPVLALDLISYCYGLAHHRCFKCTGFSGLYISQACSPLGASAENFLTGSFLPQTFPCLASTFRSLSLNDTSPSGLSCSLLWFGS